MRRGDLAGPPHDPPVLEEVDGGDDVLGERRLQDHERGDRRARQDADRQQEDGLSDEAAKDLVVVDAPGRRGAGDPA